MTTIHMDTEVVLRLVTKIKASSNDLDNSFDEVKRACRRMDWDRDDRDRFMQRLKNAENRWNDLLERQDQLANKLKIEIEEWREVDSGRSQSKSFMERFKEKIFPFTKSELTRLVSTVGIISTLKAGTTYAGQVIIKGSHKLKKSVGLFPTLNHIKATNIPKSMLKSAMKGVTPLEAGFAVIDFGDRAVKDWNNYESGTEKATAIAVDAAFVAGKTVGIHYASYFAAVGVTAGLAALSFAAPVVAAAGILTWCVVSIGGNRALDAVMETYKDDIVEKGSEFLENTGNAIGRAADSVSNSVRQVARNVDRVFRQYTLKFSPFFA